MMRILFEGGYYSGAVTIIFMHVVTPRWCQMMEHKRVWTPVANEELTCIAFPNMRRSFTTSTWTSLLHRWSSQAVLLMVSPTTWSQLFEQADAETNWGRILFHSALAIVRILFEGGYYSTCRYYSRKYGSCQPLCGLSHSDIYLGVSQILMCGLWTILATG